MRENDFAVQIEALYQRAKALQQHGTVTSDLSNDPSEQERVAALEELRTALLEELYVALEELRQQHEELLLTQQALERERLRYQDLFDGAPDGYLVTDAHGIIHEANRAAARLLNVPASVLVGKPLLLFLEKSERQTFHPRLLQLLQAGRPEEWSVWLQPRGQAPVAVGLTLSTQPAVAPAGAAVEEPGLRWLVRDITERKRVEAALRRAKEAAEAADRTKSEFLATMSHELRTPLHVIIGYLSMLADAEVGELSSQQRNIVRRIEQNAQVLFELISMVLDMNRLEAGRLPVNIKKVQMADLLAEVKAETQGLCDQSGLACAWRVAPGLPPLFTDPAKLKVVIKNLVSNAVKFTKEGGVTVAAEKKQGGIEMSVADTGIGIPPEAQAYISEPFRQVDGSTTRSYSGSGLGLHIVQRLLEVLRGQITVDSKVGQGSTFRVWLPATPPPPHDEPAGHKKHGL